MTDHLATAERHLGAAQAALEARADLYDDTTALNRAHRLEALGAAARTGLQLGTLAAAIDLAASARRIVEALEPGTISLSVGARCSEDLAAMMLDERFGVTPSSERTSPSIRKGGKS